MEKTSSSKVETLLKRENERQQDILKKRTEKKLTDAENEQYAYFNDVFDKKYQDIESMLTATAALDKKDMAEQFDVMHKEVGWIKKFMSDSLIFLRGYDVRVSNKHLQDLEVKIKKLEDSLLPKKKFGFKNKRIQKNANAHDVIDGNNMVNTYVKYDENIYGFSNCSRMHLTLERGDVYNRDVTLQNLTDCTVVIDGAPSTLHLSSLSNCQLLCGPVFTSTFAENCNDSRLVIACRQLRLHNSTSLDIYLHVTSKAIIEDCSRIRVAPYNYTYLESDEDFAKSGLDRDTNHWDSLDDFNWLVSNKPSPNWSVLDEKLRISDWSAHLNDNKVV